MSTTDFKRYDSEEPMHCANHPDVETYLRCGKCEKPICARCRVSTPAGFRCYQCANMQSVPTHAVDTTVYAKASAVGLMVAGVTGVLMGIFPGFEFWAALVMGITVPEAVAAAANQKRSPGLQWVAIGSIVAGFVVSRVVLNAYPFLLPLGMVNIPYPSGISLLDNLPFYLTQYTILWLALATVLAYKRLQ